MRFTVGSLARTRASAFNPATTAFIVHYHPQVHDASGRWAPLQLQRFDGRPFGLAAALRDGSLEVNRHTKVWASEDHVNVLPDLVAQGEIEYVPQPPVDAWEQMNGRAARERLERITATGASYFMGM